MTDPTDMASCVRHPMAVSEHVCGRCGHEFCPECVVFPFGLAKPPMCISCALEAGGIRRQHTGRPKLAPKTVKRRLRSKADEPPAPAQPAPAPVEDEQDEEWLSGQVDPEHSGGWSKTF